MEHNRAKLSKRTSNYLVEEDVSLVRVWETISLDSVNGIDQTGKRYWQIIEDKFFHFLPRGKTPTRPRSYRSLQGHWDMIKTNCSRWSGCLEQVINAPPKWNHQK
jgi:hypothetical protein